MLSPAPTTRVIGARGAADLRRSFGRLAALAPDALGQVPFSRHLFVHFNWKGDQVKFLLKKHGGFRLLRKQLEAGTFAEVERRCLVDTPG